jgi:hypothetical protein
MNDLYDYVEVHFLPANATALMHLMESDAFDRIRGLLNYAVHL